MITVLTAGKFDPVHDGHLNHIEDMGRLGNYFIVVTHTDEVVAKSSEKGVCWVPLWARKVLLKGALMYYGYKGKVVVAEDFGDSNGTVVNTLRALRPHIFARGGDRTENNMVQEELDVCEEIGCVVVYGVGKLLNSSSRIYKGTKGG